MCAALRQTGDAKLGPKQHRNSVQASLPVDGTISQGSLALPGAMFVWAWNVPVIYRWLCVVYGWAFNTSSQYGIWCVFSICSRWYWFSSFIILKITTFSGCLQPAGHCGKCHSVKHVIIVLQWAYCPLGTHAYWDTKIPSSLSELPLPASSRDGTAIRQFRCPCLLLWASCHISFQYICVKSTEISYVLKRDLLCKHVDGNEMMKKKM